MVHVLFKPQGDCSMLPCVCVRCIIPCLFLLYRGLSAKIPQAGEIWVLQCLRDSGRFQGMLEGFGTLIPSFSQAESMQSKNHSLTGLVQGI